MLHRIAIGVAGVLSLVLLLPCSAALHAADAGRPLVIASIRPLYLIVLALADEQIEVRQLLDAGSSPHDFALRPSQLRSLRDAQQIFWIGPSLEHPLAAVLAHLPGPRRDTALLAGLELPPRADGVVDPHVWLDPQRVLEIMAGVDRVLVERGLLLPDPQRVAAFAASMRDTEEAMAAEFAGLQHQPFAAMHDGYAYLVQRFGLRPPTVLALDAEQQVGARTLARMRREVREQGARCLLVERSGGNQALARAIARGSAIPVLELDSLAADVADGPDAFARFLIDTARSVAGCLREAQDPAPTME